MLSVFYAVLLIAGFIDGFFFIGNGRGSTELGIAAWSMEFFSTISGFWTGYGSMGAYFAPIMTCFLFATVLNIQTSQDFG
jgi:hypothetical protein